MIQSLFGKDGIRIIYLFDVSGSFHETTVNIATESAIEIFELIVDQSQGIPEYPQKHYVAPISSNSIIAGGFCKPTKVTKPNLYNMTLPDLSNFEDCIDNIRNHGRTDATDIYGALHQSSQILSSNRLQGKAIIMYTDMEDYSHRDQTILSQINLSEIVLVVLYEYNQAASVNTKVLTDTRRAFEENLQAMGASKYMIEHLSSVEASEIVEFLEKSFR